MKNNKFVYSLNIPTNNHNNIDTVYNKPMKFFIIPNIISSKFVNRNLIDWLQIMMDNHDYINHDYNNFRNNQTTGNILF
jgi:hypothetical protein